jgi:hypothetical protein
VEMLREYYLIYKPKQYLFEGQNEGAAYDERSLQHVLKQALAKTNIKKPVTLHWLRHSYATHLLEGGTDLRYIQEILGHSSSKTTEIYTHVSTRNIQNITSPFDVFTDTDKFTDKYETNKKKVNYFPTAQSTHICNSHKPTHRPKIAKECAFTHADSATNRPLNTLQKRRAACNTGNPPYSATTLTSKANV